MKNKILQLTDETINQIAAGEVIEQPASVVKELVDNAIDAKASKISIELKGGGRELISVQDNGSGMSFDEAPKSLLRHATSKIRSIEDLYKIQSMGFRGEALSSITSISKFRMRTKEHDSPLGTYLYLEGGLLKTQEKIPCDNGTYIEVLDLFYNVPARLKFLKAPSNQINEVVKCLTAIALSHVDPSFQLNSDGKKILECKALKEGSFLEKLKKRIEELSFFRTSDGLIPLDYKEGEYSLIGWLLPPTAHLHNRTGQMLIVNQRPVSSWMLQQAVLEGYSTTIPEGRFPGFVIHLTMPEELVDINVHPQKKEVRFQREIQIKEMIRRGVSKAILTPFVTLPLQNEPFESKKEQGPLPSFDFGQKLTPSKIALWEEKSEQLSLFEESGLKFEIPKILHFNTKIAFLSYSPMEPLAKGVALFHIARGKARLYYERTLKQESIGNSNDTQDLIPPYSIELSKVESLKVSSLLPELKIAGYSLRPFGDNTLLLEGIPSHLSLEEALSLFYEKISSTDETPFREKLIDFTERMYKPLHIEGIEHILKELLKTPSPFYSPSGKLIFALISEEEMEKKFK